MIKINLLPREIYADKARRQLASLGVGIGVLVAALLLGFYGLLKKKEISLAKQMNEAKTEESKYQAIANDVQQLEVKKQQENDAFAAKFGLGRAFGLDDD